MGYCETVFGTGVLDDDMPAAFNRLSELMGKEYPEWFQLEVSQDLMNEIYQHWTKNRYKGR